VENRIFCFTPHSCCGVTVAVRDHNDHARFNFGCMLINIWEIDGFIYLKLKSEAPFKHLTQQKFCKWSQVSKYFDIAYYKNTGSISSVKVYLLNQINGSRLFQTALHESVIDKNDGTYQYSHDGADIMLPFVIWHKK
jgi:hypothetical protein